MIKLISEFAIPWLFEIFARVGDGEAEASRGIPMVSPVKKRKSVDKFSCRGYGVADTGEGWTIQRDERAGGDDMVEAAA